MAFNKALPLFTKAMAALLKNDLSAASVAFNSSENYSSEIPNKWIIILF